MDREGYGIGIIVGAITAVVFSSIFWKDCNNDSHKALGSKGHACFANNTCREGLKCLMADGIDPTCVTR